MGTKLEKANQWLMLVTNLGVVAGFILIALQLQQNSQALEIQARAISDSTAVAAEAAFMGENIADAYAVAQLRPSELTDGQMMQVSGYLTTKLVSISQYYYGFKQGLLTEHEWLEARHYYVKEFNFPVARAYWNSAAPLWRSDFAAEIDQEYRANVGKEFVHMSEFKEALDKELNPTN